MSVPPRIDRRRRRSRCQLHHRPNSPLWDEFLRRRFEPLILLMNLDTDSAWEQWGRLDPYYGVLTHSKFRRESLTSESRKEFFDSGAAHVEYVMRMIRLHIDPLFLRNQYLISAVASAGRLFLSHREPSGS